MSTTSSTITTRKSKRKNLRSKPKLPFCTNIDDEEPIPPLSPVLCNHHFPSLELVDAEEHGMYWVSPQCDIRITNQRVRRPRAKKVMNMEHLNNRHYKCEQIESPDMTTGKLQKVIANRKSSAKEKFCNGKSAKLYSCNESIVVPETPASEQGMTFRERLLRKSTRLHNVQMVTEG